MRYFTWKLELVSNILWAIVATSLTHLLMSFFLLVLPIVKILKRLQNYKRKLFLCLPQKRRKQSQHFKLLFFTIYLLFVTWNQIPTFRRPNWSLTSSIYLGFLPLEIKGKFKQVKVYQTLILFGLKRNDQQTFKCGSSKKRFSPMCILSIQLASMNPFLCEN